MTGELSHEPINLPELQSSKFELVAADVRVVSGDEGLQHPQLTLEGDDDAFEYTFKNGRLVVRETSSGDIVVSGGRGSGSIVVSGGSYRSISISGDSIRINGASVSFGETRQGSGQPKASLLLPPQYQASHDIEVTSGDAELEHLQSRLLRVATVSGDIALRGATANSLSLKTVSGDVEVEETTSTDDVSISTVSGDVNIRGSEAPNWRVKTISGDVTARNTQGEVDAKSISGRIRTGKR